LVAGDLVLFAMGFAWLAFFAVLPNGAAGIGAAKALAGGVTPFLLGDALKIALAALAIPAGWRLLGRLRG
jgi:biotin transport system substrate-specific component